MPHSHDTTTSAADALRDRERMRRNRNLFFPVLKHFLLPRHAPLRSGARYRFGIFVATAPRRPLAHTTGADVLDSERSRHSHGT
jgi:hypothetical protein